ncbi:MAG TPA: hypothetical protein PLK76_04280 [bacterium]|nr:hypothetical protein [bacterium]
MIENQEKISNPTNSPEQNLIDLIKSKPKAEAVEASLPDILSLNKEQFTYFLKHLSKYPYRDELSQNFIEQILKHGLQLSQIVIDKKYLDFDMRILIELNYALSCHDLNFKNKHPGELNIADKTLLAFPNVYKKEFSDGLLQFWVLYHQSSILSSDIILKVLKDMNADPEVDDGWRDHIIYDLEYKIKYNGYEKVIKNDLLAEDGENQFCKQLKWLKFLRQIFINTSGDAFNKLMRIFEEVETQLPNRLLKEYLRHILEAEITPLRYNRYLKLDENKKPYFYDAEMSPEDETERLVEESQYSPTQLANIRFRRQTALGVKKISADFSGVVDKYGLKYVLDKQDNLLNVGSVLTENLRSDIAPDQKEKIINGALDFQVLADPFFVDLIKNEMGIDLLSLDLQTQFWFMDFIKDADDAKFLQVVRFVQKYRENGIKTFLALEYGEANGEKILSMADKIPAVEAQKIFKEYANLIDKTVFLKKDLQKFFVDKEADEKEKTFPVEFAEAIRRRASDLFLATQQLELKDQDFAAEDISTSLEAINLFLLIFEDFKVQNKFDFKLERQEAVTEQDIPGSVSQRIEYFVIDKESRSEYRFRIFDRPKQNKTGEARLSFTIAFEGRGIKQENKNLKDFFVQSTTDLETNEVTRNKSEFCLRLDLDMHYTKPKMSLDFGRYKREEKDKVYSGDKLGNILHQTTDAGHHNVDSFTADFGQEDIFAQVINLLGEYFSKEVNFEGQSIAA